MTTGAIQDAAADRSVTRYDSYTRREEPEANVPGGVLTFYFPQTYGRQVATLPIDLPPRWSRTGDYILASTVDHNDMWAEAVGKAISKKIAQGWQVKDNAKSEQRTKRYQQILLNANKGKGWGHFLGQHLLDYLTTNNGAFIEIIWSSPRARYAPDGSLKPIGRVLGIQHLDSARCTRLTDDDLYQYRAHVAFRYGIDEVDVTAANFPVLYTDMRGRGHLLWRWQVIDLVDMPSGRIEHRGTGLCAAARAYHTIHKMAGLERYVAEKITGERVLEIHLVNGIQAEQMSEALESAAEQQRAKRYQKYRGVVVIPALAMNAPIGGYRIPIAEVPDGFTAKDEREEERIKYATALGIPVRDLQPAPAGLNSGATALIEAERAEGTGLAAWDKQFEHGLNQWVFPETTEFGWDEGSLRDEENKAKVSKLRADTRTVMITAGEISAKQALQMAADAGDVPEEFLAVDETPQDSLDDDDKAITPEERQEAAQDTDGDGTVRLSELIGGRRAEKAGEPFEISNATKEAGVGADAPDAGAQPAREAAALIDATYKQARAWAAEVLREGTDAA